MHYKPLEHFLCQIIVGTCLVKYLVCLVIDEAHRALGNYSYCVAVREVSSFLQNSLFIISSRLFPIFSSKCILFNFLCKLHYHFAVNGYTSATKVIGFDCNTRM